MGTASGKEWVEFFSKPICRDSIWDVPGGGKILFRIFERRKIMEVVKEGFMITTSWRRGTMTTEEVDARIAAQFLGAVFLRKSGTRNFYIRQYAQGPVRLEELVGDRGPAKEFVIHGRDYKQIEGGTTLVVTSRVPEAWERRKEALERSLNVTIKIRKFYEVRIIYGEIAKNHDVKAYFLPEPIGADVPEDFFRGNVWPKVSHWQYGHGGFQGRVEELFFLPEKEFFEVLAGTLPQETLKSEVEFLHEFGEKVKEASSLFARLGVRMETSLKEWRGKEILLPEMLDWSKEVLAGVRQLLPRETTIVMIVVFPGFIRLTSFSPYREKFLPLIQQLVTRKGGRVEYAEEEGVLRIHIP